MEDTVEMNKENKREPRTEPWGTLVVQGDIEDLEWPSWMNWVLFER